MRASEAGSFFKRFVFKTLALLRSVFRTEAAEIQFGMHLDGSD